jgi:hypothetical protein
MLMQPEMRETSNQQETERSGRARKLKHVAAMGAEQGLEARVSARGGEETPYGCLARPGLRGTAAPRVSSGPGLGVVGGLPGPGSEA